jgi:xanthosine utilization system XapX-like protein
MVTSPLQLVALILALGVLGILVADTIIAIEEAQAAGCRNGVAFNASKGRCFGH